MNFEIYYHELSKNFRVLVDGNVHPLLCGFEDHTKAAEAAKKLFPEFQFFSNLVHGDTYYGSDEAITKGDIIHELERALAVVKGLPASKIHGVDMQVDIRFTSGSADGKYNSL